MKKTILLGIAALFAAVSCSKELQNESQAYEPVCGPISCNISATMPEFNKGEGVDTKANLESIVRIRWAKGDKLIVINLTTGKQLGGCVIADKSGVNTTFTQSDLVGTITAGDKLIFLLDSANDRVTSNEMDFESFVMDFSSQKGNDKDVPIVVYAEYTATENNTINAADPTFNFLVSYMQLSFAALPANTTVTAVNISNISSKCEFDISSGHEFETTPISGSLGLTESFTANSKGTNVRYFSCFQSATEPTARPATITANENNHSTAWVKAGFNAGYYYQSVATGFTNENIQFVDDDFKAYCISHYDLNNDGELSFSEAAAITSYESFTASEKSSITNVYELPYFPSGIGIPSFEGCTALKQILLPGTLTAIPENEFKGCIGLEDISIPANVTSVGEGAFEGCTSLKIFSGPYASSDRRYLVINNHVLAFAGGGTTETTIPSGTTHINNGVFANNSSLNKVSLSETLLSIGDRAFKNCTSLPIIRFYGDVTDIGEEAFYGCTSMSSAYCDVDTPPTLGNNAFSNCKSSFTVNVTSDKLEAYQASSWATYALSSAIPFNQLWYTTTDGAIFTPLQIGSGANKVNIISNTYENGKGIIVTSSDIKSLDSWFCYNGLTDQTKLSSIEMPDGVLTIGNNTFNGCSNMTSCRLSSCLTTLGEGAFFRCKLLTSIDWPENVTVVSGGLFNGSGITSITLGANVTSIGDQAFYESSLSSITLSENITSIGIRAFAETKLSTIDLPNSVTTVKDYAFDNCTSLATVTGIDHLTEIGSNAFNGCKISSVSFSSSLKSIGSSAFRSCPIEELSLPSNIETIGDHAFHGALISTLTIPNSITAINAYCFAGCKNLETLTIGDGVTSIGESAFSSCGNLESITIGENVSSMANYAFCYCGSDKKKIYVNSLEHWFSISRGALSNPANYDLYVNGEILKSLTIPDSINTIGASIFENCSSLEEVTIGENVTGMDYMSFGNCDNLKTVSINSTMQEIAGYCFAYCGILDNVILHEGLITVNRYAFSNCDALKQITLPSSVQSIGESAFSTVSTIYSKAVIPPTIESNSFYLYNSTLYSHVYVPNEAVDAYKSASIWGNYPDVIIGYTF